MKIIRLALTAVLVGLSVGAFAHGDQAHGGAIAKNAAPAQREQTDWGIAADPKAARRVIRITMSDNMRFSPDTIRVKEGETVKFVVHNAGKVLHEMVLGTPKAIEAHAALMKKFPGMEHDEAHMAHVAPGKTGTIAWTFNRPGEFKFACLVAGHYEAGMTGRIQVGAAPDERSADAKPDRR